MATTNESDFGSLNPPNINAGADPTAQNTYYSIPAIQRKLKQWYENESLVKTVTDLLKEYEGAEYIVQKGYNTVIIELRFLDSDETPILLINPTEEVTVYSDIVNVPRESVLDSFRNVQSSGTNIKVELKPDFQNRINLQESTFDSGVNEPLTTFEEIESIRPIDLICSSEINSKDLQNVQSQLPNIVASLAQLRGILSEIDPEKLQEYIDTYDSWILKIENVESLLRTIIENKEEFDEILNSIVASSGGLLGLPSQSEIDDEQWSSSFVGFPTSMNEWLQFFLNLTTANHAALFGKNSVSWRGLFDSDFVNFASPAGQDTYNELYTRLKNDGYFTSTASITSIDDMEIIDGNTLEDWFYESVEKILEDKNVVDSDAHQWYQRFKTLKSQLNSNIDLRSTGGERIIAYQAFLKAIDKIAEENINLDGFLPYIGDTQVFNYPGMETPLDAGLNNAFLYPRKNPKLDASFPNEETEDHQISNKKYMNAIMLLTYIDTTMELIKGDHVSPPSVPPVVGDEIGIPDDPNDDPNPPVIYPVDGDGTSNSQSNNTDFDGNLEHEILSFSFEQLISSVSGKSKTNGEIKPFCVGFFGDVMNKMFPDAEDVIYFSEGNHLGNTVDYGAQVEENYQNSLLELGIQQSSNNFFNAADETPPSWIAGTNWPRGESTFIQNAIHHIRSSTIEEYYERLGLRFISHCFLRGGDGLEFVQLNQNPIEFRNWAFSDKCTAESGMFNVNNPHTSKYIRVFDHIDIFDGVIASQGNVQHARLPLFGQIALEIPTLIELKASNESKTKMEMDYCGLMFGYLNEGKVEPFTTMWSQKHTYGVTYNNLENQTLRRHSDVRRVFNGLAIVTEFGQTERASGSSDEQFHLQQRTIRMFERKPDVKYWPRADETSPRIERNIMPIQRVNASDIGDSMTPLFMNQALDNGNFLDRHAYKWADYAGWNCWQTHFDMSNTIGEYTPSTDDLDGAAKFYIARGGGLIRFMGTMIGIYRKLITEMNKQMIASMESMSGEDLSNYADELINDRTYVKIILQDIEKFASRATLEIGTKSNSSSSSDLKMNVNPDGRLFFCKNIEKPWDFYDSTQGGNTDWPSKANTTKRMGSLLANAYLNFNSIISKETKITLHDAPPPPRVDDAATLTSPEVIRNDANESLFLYGSSHLNPDAQFISGEMNYYWDPLHVYPSEILSENISCVNKNSRAIGYPLDDSYYREYLQDHNTPLRIKNFLNRVNNNMSDFLNFIETFSVDDDIKEIWAQKLITSEDLRKAELIVPNITRNKTKYLAGQNGVSLFWEYLGTVKFANFVDQIESHLTVHDIPPRSDFWDKHCIDFIGINSKVLSTMSGEDKLIIERVGSGNQEDTYYMKPQISLEDYPSGVSIESGALNLTIKDTGETFWNTEEYDSRNLQGWFYLMTGLMIDSSSLLSEFDWIYSDALQKNEQELFPWSTDDFSNGQLNSGSSLALIFTMSPWLFPENYFQLVMKHREIDEIIPLITTFPKNNRIDTIKKFQLKKI